MSKRKREGKEHGSVHDEEHKRRRTRKIEEPEFDEHIGTPILEEDLGDLQNDRDSEKTAKRAQKLARQEMKRLKKAQEEESPMQNDQQEDQEHSNAVSRHVAALKGHKTPVDVPKLPDWRISNSVGGQMLDIDPIFSPDEASLLIAYDTSVAVYSTSTSLMVRRLQSPDLKGGCISGLALSALAQNELYITKISGQVERWDWQEGLRLHRWQTNSSIHSVATARQTSDAEKNGLVYTVNRKGKGLWLLSAHWFNMSKDAANTDVKPLLNYKEPLTSIRVVEAGRVIVTTAGSNLILGTCEAAPSSLKDVSYIWRIIDCPEWITSIDVRTPPLGKTSNKQKLKSSFYGSVDVVVGGLKGSIQVYEDLVRKLIKKEKSKNQEDIDSRRLHWHRNAVLAVKWAADGNYIISGGQETVLVLFQLETGRKQVLPHLGAPVESVVVSPIGSSYGIRLADNSAMILSTSELKPTFSIAGIQISASERDTKHLPFFPTVDLLSLEDLPEKRTQFPACIASSSPGRLLLAVPPATTSRLASTTPKNASYLQTFDLGSGHQISRQALTRTKITTLNMGPESNTIEEPDVVHMQTSHDGQWLATVDEWKPPQRDLAPLAFDQEGTVEEQISLRETYLKFWLWDDDTNVWELVSRIDNPHAAEAGSLCDNGRVLNLITDPSAVGFATVGEDGTVRIWRQTTRRRHGLDVKGKNGRSLVTWRCRHAIPLETSTRTSNIFGVRLSYSDDGSVLVAGIQSTAPSPLHVIDAESGIIRSVLTGLSSGLLLGLGFIDRHLIILSHTLFVWDMVNGYLHYGVDLHLPKIPPNRLLSRSHLAVNAQNGTFAIAVPESKPSKKGTASNSKIGILDPKIPTPLFTSTFAHTITVLMPARSKGGFYAIDSAAEVRTLLSSQSLHAAPTISKMAEKETSRGLWNIFGNGQKDTAGATNMGLLSSKFDSLTHERVGIDDDDEVVVGANRLKEVFDVGPGFAMPPVTELFERVARLYGGRAE